MQKGQTASQHRLVLCRTFKAQIFMRWWPSFSQYFVVGYHTTMYQFYTVFCRQTDMPAQNIIFMVGEYLLLNTFAFCSYKTLAYIPHFAMENMSTWKWNIWVSADCRCICCQLVYHRLRLQIYHLCLLLCMFCHWRGWSFVMHQRYIVFFMFCHFHVQRFHYHGFISTPPLLAVGGFMCVLRMQCPGQPKK